MDNPWIFWTFRGRGWVWTSSGRGWVHGYSMEYPLIVHEKTDIGVSTTWQTMEVKRLLTRRHSMVFQRAQSCVSQNYKNHHRKEGSPDMGNVFLFIRINVFLVTHPTSNPSRFSQQRRAASCRGISGQRQSCTSNALRHSQLFRMDQNRC